MKKNRQSSKQVFKFAEVEIIYKRRTSPKPINVSSPLEAVEAFRQVYPSNRIDYKEYFYVALLNVKNEILGISRIGEGTTQGVALNIKEIFQLALKSNATSIILSHNHPSGNLNPSNSDIQITKKIMRFANLIEIKVLDHIILTSEAYFSFANEGGTSLRCH